MDKKSTFDGSTLEYIGYSILAYLLVFFTLGIMSWYASCMLLRWTTKHTIIEGKRLQFNGKAWDLFVKSIVWILLTLVTFGIYGLWVPVKVLRWKAENTTFAPAELVA